MKFVLFFLLCVSDDCVIFPSSSFSFSKHKMINSLGIELMSGDAFCPNASFQLNYGLLMIPFALDVCNIKAVGFLKSTKFVYVFDQ